MPATTQYSPEYNQDVQAPHLALFDQSAYRLIVLPFDFVQSGEGAVASKCYLRKLPAGRVLFFPLLSRYSFSDQAASTTFDFGHAAYTEPDGDAVIADDNLFDDDVAVGSGPVDAAFGSDFTGAAVAGVGQYHEFWSKNGVSLYMTIAGDVIATASTIAGYFVIAVL